MNQSKMTGELLVRYPLNLHIHIFRDLAHYRCHTGRHQPGDSGVICPCLGPKTM